MSHIPDHIENPDAWMRGKEARIRANANRTRHRKLLAAIENDGEDFRCWLFGHLPPAVRALCDVAQAEFDLQGDDSGPASREYQAAMQAWYKSLPRRPQFLVDAMDEWGGLTDGQLAFARKVWREHGEKQAQREAERAAERANAPHWTAGRQEVTVTLLSVKRVETHFSYYGEVSYKGMWKLADGRRLYCTIPANTGKIVDGNFVELEPGDTVTLKVTIEPAKDDPTMAFGKRPK